MPIGKRRQSNAMLYTLLTFVALFILAAVAAVIFYLQFEKQRDTAENAEAQLQKVISGGEQRKGLNTIVGSVPRGKSGLGAMVDYLDQLVLLVIGEVPPDTSAQAKVEAVKIRIREILQSLAQKPVALETVPEEIPANQILESLVNRQFSAVTENFDDTMKSTLTADLLQEMWDSVTAEAGQFKQQLGIRKEKQLEYEVLFVTCEFEQGPLDMKLVYNDKNQIAGLSLVPTPADVLETYQSAAQAPAQTYFEIETTDPNTLAVVRLVEKLQMALNNLADARLAAKQRLAQLQNRFDDMMVAANEKEQVLLAEKGKHQKLVDEIRSDYEQLEDLVKQTSEQRVQLFASQLDQEKTAAKQQSQQLLQTEAKLKMSQDKMLRTQKQLEQIVPPQDIDVAAFEPDGKILLVNNQAGIVYLNIGSNDRVYRGLTFSVYEKNMPIPKNGKGKAEIEVFDLEENVSAARIITSKKTNPIVRDDFVANLVWGSDKSNVFVVAGDFDLDNDGRNESEAVDKIKSLIGKWGGTVSNAVSVNTDFVVLGEAPEILRKPTFEEMEIYPGIMDKYQDSVKNLSDYNNAQALALELAIPVFNLERFLYFIGYKFQALKAGAF